MSEWTSDGWHASHDHMPGANRELRVTGIVHANTGGYGFKLCRKEPQGINPRDLLLDLEVSEPAGDVPQVLTDYPVEYSETTDTEHDTVTVVGVTSIEVEHPE